MGKVVIIGSGVAGLASAIRLARRGLVVDVFESAEKSGGKISQRMMAGFRFDAGPSLLTLPDMVLGLLDNDLRFEVKKLAVITKYFYPDGVRLTAFSDTTKMAKEFSAKLNIPEKRIVNYLRKSERVFRLTSDLFIFGSFHRLKNLMNLSALKTLLNFRQLQAFSSLHDFNEKQLGEKHLVQLFDRYATYNGSNPYKTPATLSVIAHLEHNTGAFIPEKGMFEVTRSLFEQAHRLGVQFHFGETVEKVVVSGTKASGVSTNKANYPADLVISDIDIHRFYSSLLPDAKRLRKIEKEERSSSALIFYWGINGIFLELDIHNIFFSDNYSEEFHFLFEKQEIFDDPTIYIYVSSKYRKDDAPEGCENWFVMINAPADLGQNWQAMIEKSRRNILEKLGKMLGKNIEKLIVAEEILSPPGIYMQTGSVNGSLYGTSSNSRYASFNRHPNFRNDIAGLYFVGGSVHPGGGIPLCLSSARIVDKLIAEQLKKQKK